MLPQSSIPLYQTPQAQAPVIPPPTSEATMETLSNQVFSLSQCILALCNKVNENHRLFEENIRLKDIVIDLEFKLKDESVRQWRVGSFNIFEKTRHIETSVQQNLQLSYD